MTSQVSKAHLVGFSAGTIVASIAAVLTVWLAGTPARRTAQGADSALARRIGSLEAELVALRTALERSAPRAELARPSVSAPNDAMRVPAGESSGDDHELALSALRADIRRLEQTLAEELAATREIVRAADKKAILERIKEDPRDVLWAEWDPIVELWRLDREGARKEVHLMTDAQVLERFGPPTDVWSNQSGITWQYARGHDPSAKTWEVEIILRMSEGYVSQLAIRLRE